MVLSVVMVSTVVMPGGSVAPSHCPEPGPRAHGGGGRVRLPGSRPSPRSLGGEARPVPRDTLAGTAAWLIQKETQDMATSRMDGM